MSFKSNKTRKATVPTHALPPCTWEGDTMVIKLYIPAYILSPNGRAGHWSRRSKAVKHARGVANLFTLKLLAGDVPPCPVGYSLAYYWPGTARDDDNAISSAKSYLDGICSALGVDDRSIRFRSLYHHRDRVCPRLEVILHLAKP